MTSENRHNFVADLVEMARATEQLPVVQGQLVEAEKRLDELRNHITNVELALLNRKDEIEQLNEALRKMEVQRDDAEFRFLDAEDRTEKALAFVRSIFGNAGSLIQALEPPKPEPVAQPVPDMPSAVAVQGAEPVSGVMGQSEANPPSAPSMDSQSAPVSSATISDTASSPSLTEGVGVQQDPTTAPTLDSRPAEAPAFDGSATSAASPSTEPPFSDKRFVGKLYINTPGWHSRVDWLAGGGTNETYDWREGSDLPDGFFRDYLNRPQYRFGS